MMEMQVIGSRCQARRDELREHQFCRFVDPEEYRQLLVSSRQLLRADEPGARLRGLVDPSTGTRFMTEEERLFPPE